MKTGFFPEAPKEAEKKAKVLEPPSSSAADQASTSKAAPAEVRLISVRQQWCVVLA
jgi:hypothetical protein